MNKQDFIDWLSQPVTKAFFASVKERIDLIKEELSYSAGQEPQKDAYKAGAIQALRDITDTDWFEETEND